LGRVPPPAAAAAAGCWLCTPQNRCPCWREPQQRQGAAPPPLAARPCVERRRSPAWPPLHAAMVTSARLGECHLRATSSAPKNSEQKQDQRRTMRRTSTRFKLYLKNTPSKHHESKRNSSNRFTTSRINKLKKKFTKRSSRTRESKIPRKRPANARKIS